MNGHHTQKGCTRHVWNSPKEGAKKISFECIQGRRFSPIRHMRATRLGSSGDSAGATIDLSWSRPLCSCCSVSACIDAGGSKPQDDLGES
jgi:hypothetical protein